jgi:hypothetical protein
MDNGELLRVNRELAAAMGLEWTDAAGLGVGQFTTGLDGWEKLQALWAALVEAKIGRK